MSKRLILILLTITLIFSGISLISCNGGVVEVTPTPTPISDFKPSEELDFIKGVNYASWTKGEFPFTTSWKPQDYLDSQGITGTTMKFDANSFERGYLELSVDLKGRSDNKRQGEVFTDLRYPSIYEARTPFQDPVNFAHRVLSAMVFCPKGSGNDYAPSGIQIFLKSVKVVDGKEVWSSWYGDWHNIWQTGRDWTASKELGDIREGRWSLIAADLSKKPIYGYVDGDFDPTNVVLIGIKVGLNRNNNSNFNGKFLVDNFGWGISVPTGNKEIDRLPIDANTLENPQDNYNLFNMRVKNEVLFTFEQTKNPINVLKETGHNAISIVPTHYMENNSSVSISPHPQKTNIDADVETLIQLAKANGLKVFLKPHVDVLDGTWRGEINPTNIDEWFNNYTAFIVNYAKIAQRNGVDCLIIGTEFKTLQGTEYRDQWLKVISEIEKVYSDFLTYSANWDDYWKVSFWDKLDFIGIDAYFPLSDEENPTLDELVQGWGKWQSQLADFSQKTGKSVVFTELGYRSIDYAAREPWEYQKVRPVNEGLQKRCFEATLTAFGDKEWFGGFLIWDWSPRMDYGGEFNIDFTTQYKKAETIFQDFQGLIHNKTIKRQSGPGLPEETPTPQASPPPTPQPTSSPTPPPTPSPTPSAIPSSPAPPPAPPTSPPAPPQLNYSPKSLNFGSVTKDYKGNMTFEVWNAGKGTLSYTLSVDGDWCSLNPMSGTSTGEHDAITVYINACQLAADSYSANISITTNAEQQTLTITVNVSAPATVGSLFGSVSFGTKAYSPDGRMYAREIEPRDYGHFGIFEVCTDRELKEIKVTQHPDGEYWNDLKGMAWSPDSKLLAVMYHHYGGGHISLVDVDAGSQIKYISFDGWPHSIQFSPDGKQIIVGSTIIEIQ